MAYVYVTGHVLRRLPRSVWIYYVSTSLVECLVESTRLLKPHNRRVLL